MNGSTNFPVNFSNLRGIPMIASTSVTVTDTNVIIGIPRRAFRGLADSGIIAFRLTQEIPASGASLPISFSSADFLQALTLVGGANATGDNMTAAGVYLIWYDKCASSMQMLTIDN